jgi:hypothetical protein
MCVPGALTMKNGNSEMRVIELGHGYELKNFERCPNPDLHNALWFVKMDEDGVYHNGTTNEEVLAVLVNRMRYLNDKFPCRENSIVITKLEEALMWLERRTADRSARGVEGKHEA